MSKATQFTDTVISWIVTPGMFFGRSNLQPFPATAEEIEAQKSNVHRCPQSHRASFLMTVFFIAFPSADIPEALRLVAISCDKGKKIREKTYGWGVVCVYKCTCVHVICW